MKKIYYVTFGQRSPFNDSWVEILATDKKAATDEAFDIFGQQWANVYEEDQFDESTKAMYPEGKVGRTVEGL